MKCKAIFKWRESHIVTALSVKFLRHLLHLNLSCQLGKLLLLTYTFCPSNALTAPYLGARASPFRGHSPPTHTIPRAESMERIKPSALHLSCFCISPVKLYLSFNFVNICISEHFRKTVNKHLIFSINF